MKIAGLKFDVGGSDWLYMSYCIGMGPVRICLITEVIEFVCAQSPYKMRGLLIGCAGICVLPPFFLGRVLNGLFEENIVCKKEYYPVIQSCFSAAVSLIGFILYCFIARWYKMRVRDEDYDVHRVVEEVYDRYLSSQNVQHDTK